MLGTISSRNRITNARAYLNAVTRIFRRSAAIALVCLWPAAMPAQAQTSGVYLVAGVAVDRTADTAAAARRQAIVDGHRQAFDRLMARLVPAGQRDALPALEHAEIVPMVLSFGIDEEKTSRVRYIGKLRFQFRQADVRRFLNDAGIGFAETRSKPVLLLPVLDVAGAKLLWDDPNPWFAAWNSVPPSDGLVPLRLPVGDLADVRDISAEQASSGSATPVALIAERYGTATVVVAEASVAVDAASGARAVNVALRYLGGAWSDRTGIRSFAIADGETDQAAMARAAGETARQIEEDWKRENLLQLNTRNSLIADIALTELREWVEIRQRLRRVAFLQNTQLVAVSRVQASVRLTYFGFPEQLKTALAQRDLILEQSAVNWTLRDARVPPAEPASPAETAPSLPETSGEAAPAPDTEGAPR